MSLLALPFRIIKLCWIELLQLPFSFEIMVGMVPLPSLIKADNN
jgi:hypothetical protein